MASRPSRNTRIPLLKAIADGLRCEAVGSGLPWATTPCHTSTAATRTAPRQMIADLASVAARTGGMSDYSFARQTIFFDTSNLFVDVANDCRSLTKKYRSGGLFLSEHEALVSRLESLVRYACQIFCVGRMLLHIVSALAGGNAC